ncbi:hypothetical protein [Brevibacillus fortis]
MLDKDLLVERLEAEGFAKSARKVKSEPENKDVKMKKEIPGVGKNPEN